MNEDVIQVKLHKAHPAQSREYSLRVKETLGSGSFGYVFSSDLILESGSKKREIQSAVKIFATPSRSMKGVAFISERQDLLRQYEVYRRLREGGINTLSFFRIDIENRLAVMEDLRRRFKGNTILIDVYKHKLNFYFDRDAFLKELELIIKKAERAGIQLSEDSIYLLIDKETKKQEIVVADIDLLRITNELYRIQEFHEEEFLPGILQLMD